MLDNDDLPWNQRVESMLRVLGDKHVKLTARQAEVLCLQALSLDFIEIAAALHLSRRTVDFHAHHAWRNVVPAEYVPTRDRATLWAFLHRNCCLRREFHTYLTDGAIA